MAIFPGIESSPLSALKTFTTTTPRPRPRPRPLHPSIHPPTPSSLSLLVEIEDLICSNKPLGFSSSSFFLLPPSRPRQFFKPQHLLQHSGKTGTKHVPLHYIPASRRLPRLSPFCCIFREKCEFPAAAFVPAAAETPCQPATDAAGSASAVSALPLWCLVSALTAPLLECVRQKCTRRNCAGLRLLAAARRHLSKRFIFWIVAAIPVSWF